MEQQTTNRKFITGKTVVNVTILVALLTILSIWLLGLDQHRTLFENAILSIGTLSLIFFLFLTIGLYKGLKIKDNLGKITDNIRFEKMPDLAPGSGSGPALDIPHIGDDFVGIVLGFLAWFLFSILLILFIWLFGAILWTMILVFAAMLYWIFFRAIRMVFKNANKCKGKLTSSIAYGLGYTTLYTFWIYGIVLAAHYLFIK